MQYFASELNRTARVDTSRPRLTSAELVRVGLEEDFGARVPATATGISSVSANSCSMADRRRRDIGFMGMSFPPTEPISTVFETGMQKSELKICDIKPETMNHVRGKTMTARSKRLEKHKPLHMYDTCGRKLRCEKNCVPSSRIPVYKSSMPSPI